MENLNLNHYSTDAERFLKDGKQIILKSVYVKEAKAKQKPSIKQLGAWAKARILEIKNGKVLARVVNREDEPLEIHSLAITFMKDDEEVLFSWGSMDNALIKVNSKGSAILVYAPNTHYKSLLAI